MKFIFFFISTYNIIIKYDKLYYIYQFIEQNNFKISIIFLILFLSVFSYVSINFYLFINFRFNIR